MGQLERYGLYVLCLVIFLILGVAIWGGDPQAANNEPSLTNELEQAPDPMEGGAVPSTPMGEAMTLSRLLDASSVKGIESDPEVAAPALPDAEVEAETVSMEPQTETPVATQARYYVIQKGDSYTEISQRELGTWTRWEEILALNPGTPEGKLIPGEKLLMPPRDPATPVTSGKQYTTYTVVKGDNPSKISVKRYGDESYAQKILDLNPGMDPLKMKPGSLIRVPLRK